MRHSAGRDWQSKVMGDTATQPAAANYIGLTEDNTAPADGDTALTGELAVEGLSRAQGVFAHTTGANTYTITKTFTKTSGATRTIRKGALFNAAAAGTMPFSSLFASSAVMEINDTVTVTATVSLV